MAQVSTYLVFNGTTDAAFEFYKSVFGTEYTAGPTRFRDIPVSDDYPGPSDAEKDLIINVQLPILGGHLLQGTDSPEAMGGVTQGNNVNIALLPDTRGDAQRLFSALSAGGQVEMDLQEMFWGGYYGSCTDKFGIHWMINTDSRD